MAEFETALEARIAEREPHLYVAIEEYRALRQEIVASLHAQHSVLSFGAGSVALLAGAIAARWNSDATLSSLALMGVIPYGLTLMFAAWMNEVTRMRRAGSYLRFVTERKIGYLLGDRYALAWEAWLGHDVNPPIGRARFLAKPRNLHVGIATISVVLVGFTAVSFGVGAYHLEKRAAFVRHSVSDYNDKTTKAYWVKHPCHAATNQMAKICIADATLRASLRNANVLFSGWRWPWRGVRRGWLVILGAVIGIVVPLLAGGWGVVQTGRRFEEHAFPSAVPTRDVSPS